MGDGRETDKIRIMKRILTVTLVMVLAFTEARAEKIKGTVTDTEGKAIAGVVVSDGLMTTKTDSKGRFCMDTDVDSRFVFISTPSGYISSSENDGTSYYKKIDSKTRSYDFKVVKNPKNDRNHNIIVIADPQISDAEEFPELTVHSKDIGQHVRSMDGDYTFGICLGDIVGWNHALYPQYREVMSHTGIVFRNVMGNHDMTNYGASHETSMKDYEDFFGPAWYSFNVGKVHYVVLNDNFFVGRDWFYIGYIDGRQLEWLAKDLSYVPKDHAVVVSMHIPTTLSKEDRDAFRYGEISDVLCNKKALYEMLKPYKSLILSGHMHTGNNQIIDKNLMEQNITGLCGAWWCGPVCIDGAPVGYKVFEFDGTEMKWQYKSSGKPLDHQFKVYTDDPQNKGFIVANVWDYDPEWKVEYYEDGKKICDMERFKGYDPVALECYKDASKLKHLWVHPAMTENMFKARISESARSLEVRVTDRFGRTFTQSIDR